MSTVSFIAWNTYTSWFCPACLILLINISGRFLCALMKRQPPTDQRQKCISNTPDKYSIFRNTTQNNTTQRISKTLDKYSISSIITSDRTILCIWYQVLFKNFFWYFLDHWLYLGPPYYTFSLVWNSILNVDGGQHIVYKDQSRVVFVRK